VVRDVEPEITFGEGDPVSDEQLKLQKWQIALQDLIRERDREKINEQSLNLQGLIFERFQQLDKESGVEAERQALKEALTIIRIIMADPAQDRPDTETSNPDLI